MKKIIQATLLVVLFASFFISCKKDEPQSNPFIVSQFVYDGMSTFYLWADDIQNKKPTSTDATAYFNSLLSNVDKKHGWSWITDDVDALISLFSGTPIDFGYEIAFVPTQKSDEVVAVIKYVFPNTPASQQGLKRLDFITQINGQPITEKNYKALYGRNSIELSISKLTTSGLVFERKITVTPAVINTNPVLYSNIYEVGDKKIGYLFYTDFIANYNDKLYDKFLEFKTAGVTDLVLDLRYNHGGAVTSAIYLSSLIAPAEVVKSKAVFTTMSYNNFLNTTFDKLYREAADKDKYRYDRKDYIGTYIEKDIFDDAGKLVAHKERDPLGANLNLNKVYIIATGNSYSASELTIHGLKSHMNVVHIGDTTGGKYTASWTLHPYDDEKGVAVYEEKKLSASDKDILKKWAMQPIVAKYTNKEGVDFSNPGYLTPDIGNTMKEGFGSVDNWKMIGDTKDVYLGQAIYLITGNPAYKPQKARQGISNSYGLRLVRKDVEKEFMHLSKSKGQSLILDNLKLTSDDWKKIISSK